RDRARAAHPVRAARGGRHVHHAAALIMARRPILITGGTGFVGSAVVRRLLEPGVARDIRVLSRHALPDWMTASGVRHIPADLSRLSTVDTVDIGDAGTVLHLAVHIGSDPV